MDRLIERFPMAAPAALLPLLDDTDTYLVFRAAEVIAASGDAERFRAPLSERLPSAKGRRFGRLIEALARLDAEAARPWLLERARRGQEGLETEEYLSVALGLGLVGGEAARRALGTMLAGYKRDAFGAMAVVEGLLQAAQPDDIGGLVRRLRAWPATRRTWRTSLSALPEAAGAGRVYEEMMSAVDGGVPTMLQRAANWLGRQPPLDMEQVRTMTRVFSKQPADMFPALLAEAVRLTQVRGDDVEVWRAQWDAGARLTGYRRQAVITLQALQAFQSRLVPHPERLPEEAVVGLALVCQLSVDEDDEGRLAASDDKAGALLAILAQEREHVLPDSVEQVANLGVQVVPALTSLLEPGSGAWGAIRAARALAQLAQRDPESCQTAIPALIARVAKQEGDFLPQACSAALSAIGPAVVEPIAAALNDDTTRDIYLTGVLSKIPTERSAEIIMDLLARKQPEDWRDLDMYAGALADTGSPTAIDVLEPLWEPGDAHLAEHLLVLHVVNGLEHIQMPVWRKLVQDEDARVTSQTESLRFTLNDADELLPGDSAPPRLAPAVPVPPARPEPGGRTVEDVPRKQRRKHHRSRR